MVAATFGLLLAAAPAMAQFERPLPLGPGDPFPEIDVYDAGGKTFNTKSLKGKYTVVVNGCLT
jgi:hypothetical protein